MTDAQNESLKFRTSEMAVVAVLRLLNFRIETLERNNGKVTFCFEEDKRLNQAVNDFYAHKLQIDPLAYFNSMREVKSLIYRT